MAELLTAISEISTLYLQRFDTHSPSASPRLSLFLPFARFLGDLKTIEWIISKHKWKYLFHGLLHSGIKQAVCSFFFLYDCFISDCKLVLVAII